MNKQKTRRPELLAPAGNMEKFFTALHFGADAVYLAGKNFGLRAFADNFTLDEIKFCCGYAHEKGKKVYVTVNIFADGRDLEKLPDYISALDNCGADALIVSDAGVMQIAKSVAPRRRRQTVPMPAPPSSGGTREFRALSPRASAGLTTLCRWLRSKTASWKFSCTEQCVWLIPGGVF